MENSHFLDGKGSVSTHLDSSYIKGMSVQKESKVQKREWPANYRSAKNNTVIVNSINESLERRTLTPLKKKTVFSKKHTSQASLVSNQIVFDQKKMLTNPYRLQQQQDQKLIDGIFKDALRSNSQQSLTKQLNFSHMKIQRMNIQNPTKKLNKDIQS